MKCPACPSKLTEIRAYGLKLDVCADSCGGVWFDAGELEHIDEEGEQLDGRVLRPMSNQKVAVDKNRTRSCPRCENTLMKKVLEDELSLLEVDVCPGCEGVFLDFGELANLRENNSARTSRGEVIDKYLNQYSKNPENVPKKLRAVCELLFR